MNKSSFLRPGAWRFGHYGVHWRYYRGNRVFVGRAFPGMFRSEVNGKDIPGQWTTASEAQTAAFRYLEERQRATPL